MDRNEAGQFLKGQTVTPEMKAKSVAALTKAWVDRADYIKDVYHPYIHNVWRSFKFTTKGKKIGHDEAWDDYRTFYNDVFPTYQSGLVFQRINKKLPFSKDNFIWTTSKLASILKESTITLTYNGETLSIREWSEKLGLSYCGMRIRYYRYQSVEEVLFGKKRATRRPTNDSHNLPYQKLRDKASKMCASYKAKDRINRREYDLTADWLIENILFELCHYCGTDKMIGCDRRNNSKGHTKNNVIPCCHVCNTTRNNNFSVEEMEILGKTISEINKKRKDIIR